MAAKDDGLVEDAAKILVEAFPQAWPDMKSGIKEVMGCLGEGKVALVAVEDGHAISFIGGQPQYGTTGWELHPLVVSTGRQRSGVGTQLVATLEAEIAKRGGVMIYLGSDDENGKTSLSDCDVHANLFRKSEKIKNINRHPYEFYQKLGYRIVGVIPDANGIGKPYILMTKRLGADTAPHRTPEDQ